MSKVKVDGDGFKTFEAEIKELNLTERAEINDVIFDPKSEKNFSFWVEVIKKGTNYDEDEINRFSNEEIYGLGSRIITEMNKKK